MIIKVAMQDQAGAVEQILGLVKMGVRYKMLREIFKNEDRDFLRQSGEKKDTKVFKKSVFQKPYRIILGPPKHVLHLVWSVLGIYTAIIKALKVAPTGSSKWSINGKVKHYN